MPIFSKERKAFPKKIKLMEHRSSHFSGGFMLGVVIGAALVYLVATEKGKKVLKAVTDEGLKNISELIEESELEDEILEEVEPVEEVVEEPQDLENKETPKKTTKKRFFRRVKK